MVGRYHPVKRHDIFLLSALQLLEQESSVRFVLVGRDVEWSNPAIAGIVPEEKRNYFFVLGERNDVHTIIPAFDIAVSTSDSESFPNVVGEAMACGVPCIVTDAGDSPMVVGDTGIAIPRDDINALTEALKKLIKLPREERYKLGVSARERILKGYSLSTMVSQYEKLFCEVADVQSAEK
jgi:glycosyltransferase involved in cell wall biosynthesis